MTPKRCAIFDESDDRQCRREATMVRTVCDRDVTRTFYCDEHGDAHGGVLMAVADRLRDLRTRAVARRDDALVRACDRALLGDDDAVQGCVEILESGEESAS